MSHPKIACRPNFWFLVVTLLMPACADTVYYASLNNPPQPMSIRSAEQVQVLLVTPPARPHTDLGLIQVIHGLNGHDIHEMLGSLREYAAKLGCDALLVNWIDLRSGKHQTPSVEGSCIVYNDVSTVPNDGLKTPAVSTAPAPPQPPAPHWLPAWIATSPGLVRTAPNLVAPLATRLEIGHLIWISSEATDGWRVLKLPGGRLGYIQDSAIRRP